MGIFTSSAADYRFEDKGDKVVCLIKPMKLSLIKRLFIGAVAILSVFIFIATVISGVLFFMILSGSLAFLSCTPYMISLVFLPARFTEAFYLDKTNRTMNIKKNLCSLVHIMLNLPGVITIPVDEIRSIGGVENGETSSVVDYDSLYIHDKLRSYRASPKLHSRAGRSLKEDLGRLMYELFGLSFGGVKVYL